MVLEFHVSNLFMPQLIDFQAKFLSTRGDQHLYVLRNGGKDVPVNSNDFTGKSM